MCGTELFIFAYFTQVANNDEDSLWFNMHSKADRSQLSLKW